MNIDADLIVRKVAIQGVLKIVLSPLLVHCSDEAEEVHSMYRDEIDCLRNLF